MWCVHAYLCMFVVTLYSTVIIVIVRSSPPIKAVGSGMADTASPFSRDNFL